MAASRVSGEMREVRLDQGVIRYREEGSGPTLLFVHGILVNGLLCRKVVPLLSGRFRCVVPDLPLGAHSVAMREDADMGPRGVARIIADFMAALDLGDLTLVGNDTGGAICQIVVSENPERIGRLILTNCDAYESFFPLILSPFHHGARIFGEHLTGLLAWVLRHRLAQRLLFWTVARQRVDAATLDAYFSSFLRDAGVRRDVTRFLADVSGRYTLEAARSFPFFRRPVLIVWGKDDFYFLPRLAHRLQRDFPDAELEFVSGSRALVPEDRPERLAELIGVFLEVRVGAR